MLKKDFPVFEQDTSLVYFDSASTTQKPAYVLGATSAYIESSYANIHRGAYDLAEQSQLMFDATKSMVTGLIGAEDRNEIIFTSGATASANLLARTLLDSDMLKDGDRVLLSIAEHHANVVPWFLLQKYIELEIVFVGLDENHQIDMKDFEEKYTSNTKVVSFIYTSNVTGSIFDLESVKKVLRDNTLFIVDATQAVPHHKIDVQKVGADFVFFSGHKMFAQTGTGVLWGKKDVLKSMTPAIGGGGAISSVQTSGVSLAGIPDKFEPGTPNLIGVASLQSAIKYIESIGGYEAIEKHSHELSEYFLQELKKRSYVQLLGSDTTKNRVATFSFVVEDMHVNDVADYLADNNICVRTGHHCCQPLLDFYGFHGCIRVSMYIYNTTEEIDRLFELLDKLVDNV